MSEKLGVVLFNLGGPETLADVRPFLYNLFCDIEIIKPPRRPRWLRRLPWQQLQKPLAWLIATTRHKKSSALYEKIGGGSPLRRITDAQAAALAAELARRGRPAKVYVAMRCWQPTTEMALAALEKDGIQEVVALPLYPQFSISTTRSSFRYFIKLLARQEGQRQLRRHYISKWYDHPGYIAALVETIEAARAKLPNSDPTATHLIFSAHSVPESYLAQGEPYLRHTQQTVAAVMAALGTQRPYTLAFQSKVGPVKWLEPFTDEVLRNLAKQGTQQVLVVPISFVSEHIETLYELDILYQGVAQEVGIPHFTRAEALNTNPTFISALADLVEEKLARSPRRTS
jgi:protoporphyrin/coproporphyrin ferrochelatase